MTASKKVTRSIFEAVPFWYPPEVIPFFMYSNEKLATFIRKVGLINRYTIPSVLAALVYGVLGRVRNTKDTALITALIFLESLRTSKDKEVNTLFCGDVDSFEGFYLQKLIAYLSSLIENYEILDSRGIDFLENFEQEPLYADASMTFTTKWDSLHNYLKKQPSSDLKTCFIAKVEIYTLYQLLLGLRTFPHKDVLVQMSLPELSSLFLNLFGVDAKLANLTIIFALNRLDVFCLDDEDLINGIRKVHGLKNVSVSFLNRLDKKFAPFASLASLFYWEAWTMDLKEKTSTNLCPKNYEDVLASSGVNFFKVLPKISKAQNLKLVVC